MEETKSMEEETVAEETKTAKSSDCKNDKKKLKKLEAELAEAQKQLEAKDAAWVFRHRSGAGQMT